VARRQDGMDRPLRVAVAGLSLRYPHTGTGRYAREVIAALAEQSDVRATVVLGQDAERPVTARGRVGMVYPPSLPFRPGNHGDKLYWEQVGFRWAAIRTRADVWYSPHFAMPLMPSRPTVLSVHDMIPYTMPEYAGTRAARAYFRLQALAAKQATSVVTLSAHAKTEIQRLLGIDATRVHVVMPGVDGAFSPVPGPEARVRARKRYGLGDRYMLYVGGADARKNIGVLLRAISLLTNHDDVPELVVVAGEPKPGQETLFPDWRAQARALGLGDRVRFIALVAEEDLAEVYRGADVFCFPSRAEGFGLNPLEAMACGTAVISSNTTSLPEAVGDAGLLVAPDDADGWARAILQVSGDAALRADLERRGLERAATFQWAETGARVVDIIRAARS
jgi:glycosyltransferase involved in cell wall biosynthesis